MKNYLDEKSLPILPFLAGLFLLLGIIDFPIGYYTFLRIVVFCISAILIISEYKQKQTISIAIVILGLILILFNPIIPVYLGDPHIWKVLDLLAGAIMCVYGVIKVKEAGKSR